MYMIRNGLIILLAATAPAAALTKLADIKLTYKIDL